MLGQLLSSFLICLSRTFLFGNEVSNMMRAASGSLALPHLLPVLFVNILSL